MDIEKLKETLAANGVDEETIAKVIADLEKEPEDDKKKEGNDAPVDGKPEDGEPTAKNDEEGQGDDNPKGDEDDGNSNEEGNKPQDDIVPPVQNDEVVPPTDIPPTDVPPEDVVPPTDVPPTDVPPAIPPIDPRFEEAMQKVEEQAKTIEGLLARVDSLEGALAQAGVLDKSDANSEVGVDESILPQNGSNGAVDAFDDALAVLNGKRKY